VGNGRVLNGDTA